MTKLQKKTLTDIITMFMKCNTVICNGINIIDLLHINIKFVSSSLGQKIKKYQFKVKLWCMCSVVTLETKNGSNGINNSGYQLGTNKMRQTAVDIKQNPNTK